MAKLQPVRLPDLGVPLAPPGIPGATLAARCDALHARAGASWLFVYADREHGANLQFLCGFEPRFEEAVLLLGPGGRRVLLAGNECEGYAATSPLPGLDVLLCQSLSLMAQDRTRRPSLEAALREAGLRPGDTVGVVGWKYLEPEEWHDERPGFLVPHAMVVALARVVGGLDGLTEATPHLMNPRDGLRSIVDADQIAVSEWASSRASTSVWAALTQARPGQTEMEAAGRLRYAGEPLAVHTMFVSGDARHPIHGLASPGGRIMARGDGVTTAFGLQGGLSSRAGLLDDDNDAFVGVAGAYFDGLVRWYDTAAIGVAGGALHDAVVDRLAEGALRPALNPGHLVGHDEWSHSPVRPGSADALRSGIVFQVDVIPTPLPSGWALNCEDAVAVADAGLRAEIAGRHPEAWARIEARRTFMRDELGVALRDCLLPLSNIPLALPPLWLASDRLLVNA